jgi:hypothetical protein
VTAGCGERRGRGGRSAEGCVFFAMRGAHDARGSCGRPRGERTFTVVESSTKIFLRFVLFRSRDRDRDYHHYCY